MVDFNTLVTVLGVLSSGAIVLSAVFVLLQLRQNARLIEATLNQSRSAFSLSLMERVTDESFPRRRARFYEVLAKYVREPGTPMETPEDFEIRNFAYIYELLGVMTKHRMVDLELVLDSLQYIVVRDWEKFGPHAERMRTLYGLEYHPYSNFQWLAKEARTHMDHRTQEQKSGLENRPTHNERR